VKKLLAFLIYFSLVLVFHWEAATAMSSKILAGAQVGGVFVWEGWWFGLNVFGKSDLDPFFTKMIMYPVGCPIVIHAPLTTGLGLILKGFFNPYIAYNFLFLMSYMGAGIGMFFLAYSITKNFSSALLSGYFFMFSHYSLTQHLLGHLGESMVLFVPVLFLGLWKLFKNQNRSNWTIFFIGALGVCLTTPYVALATLGVGLPVFVWIKFKKTINLKHQRHFFIKLGSTLMVIFLMGLIAYGPILTQLDGFLGGRGSYSLSLLSFIDFPAWHPSETIQDMRRLTSGMTDNELVESPQYLSGPEYGLRAKPENLMGFLSFTVLTLLFLGWRRKLFKGQGIWVGLLVAGFLLSLGPFLNIAFQETSIPLPYLIFDRFPILGAFRTPSRFILLWWVGASVLAAIAMKDLLNRIPKKGLKIAFSLGLFLIFGWEMGLSKIGNWFMVIEGGEAYEILKRDKSSFGVLEVPVAVGKRGDISINAQTFMLHQPLHGKPLIVARPPRHTKKSLSFCEETDVVYELTHPHAIRKIYSDPRLKDRLDFLRGNGKAILEKNKVKYILFHTRDRFFNQRVHEDYFEFISDVLGEPLLKDKFGIHIYKVY